MSAPKAAYDQTIITTSKQRASMLHVLARVIHLASVSPNTAAAFGITPEDLEDIGRIVEKNK